MAEPEFSEARYDELTDLSTQLGFFDDVLHWNNEKRKYFPNSKNNK